MKRAIIMGATSGIGRRVALDLLQQGYTIGVAGRRTEALEQIKRVAPERVVTKVIDVTASNAPTLLNELISEMGGVDLYFHSSGYGKQNTELTPDIEHQTVMTNALGFTQMVDAAFNHFKENGQHGHIAVISSVAGTRGMGAAPSYSATKRFQWHYIDALAQLARMEHLDISFTDIRPGFVDTAFIAGSNFPMTMNEESVSRRILEAISKKKRRVIIDWRYDIVCFFWRMIPSWIWERMNIK